MRLGALVALLTFASPAAGEVVSSAGNGFELRYSITVPVDPATATTAFADVSRWWNPEHTYSGKTSNLTMQLRPGGCFCERLSDGGVEHLRIAYVDRGKRIVLTGSLGPLLYLATTGAMDVSFKPIAGGSQVTVDYRVAGFANGGADKLAPLVDSVLANQIDRYRAFASAPTPP